MNTSKHVITLSIKGESVKFTAHTTTNKKGEAEITALYFVNSSDKLLEVKASILINPELNSMAMYQVQQLENFRLADILEKEIKPCLS